MTRIPGYDTLNPDQYQIATEFNDPVFVAAGAGSGKTFALTKRVLRAMQPGSAVGPEATEGPAVLDSLVQALVITFTEKAAAEIKERVRAELLQNGFAEEALQVDTAWVSTIHGMCSRILRDNALELGIDPEFKVLDANVSDELRARAMDHAVSELHRQNACQALFESYELQKDFDNREQSGTITNMVGQLMDAAASSCRGMDAVQLASMDSFDFASEVRCIADMYSSLADDEEQLLNDGSIKDSPAKRNGIPVLREAAEQLHQLKGQDPAAIVECLCECGLTSVPTRKNYQSNYWKGTSITERGDQAALRHKALVAEAALQGAQAAEEDLLTVARAAWDEYKRLKAERGALDNDDLLNMTLAAFESNPQLAEACARQFKLVMVDEFQDTNQQQVRIIEHLIADNPAKLITVGDAQQSIYRFRGADVDVFTRQQGNADALQVRMTENYRSHDDVLRLVRQVCEGQQGAPSLLDGFMDLLAEQNDADPQVAAKAKERHEAAYLAGQPRVFVESACGKADEARMAVADAIAERFAELNRGTQGQGEEGQGEEGQEEEGQGGIPLGSMALLAGTTSNLALYLDALKRHGLDYVVSGGSNFNKLDEVQVVAALLRTLANPYDTEEGLFPVLQSGMFKLTLDDLCALATQEDDKTGTLWKGSLARMFTEPGARVPEGVGSSGRMQAACAVLHRAFASLGSKPVADVCRQAVVESGWLARLQDAGVDGMAQAANVLAALDYVGTLADEMGLGASRAAYEFDKWLESVKAGPASLSGEAQDAIRVMTIHASKGLQFPVVAVVECFKDPYSTTLINGSPLALARCGDAVFASLSPSNSVFDGALKTAVLEGLAQVDVAEGPFDASSASAQDLVDHYRATTRASWHLLLKHRETQSELAEVARLIYVALTRAEEALIVGLSGNGKGNSKPFGDDDPGEWALGDVFERVGHALFGAHAKEWLTEPAQVEFDYGGQAKGVLCSRMVDAAAAGPQQTEAAGSGEVQLYKAAPVHVDATLAGRAHPDVYSFSSASRVLEAEAEAAQDAGQVAEGSKPSTIAAAAPDGTAHPGDASLSADDEPDTPAIPAFDSDRATNFGSALHMCAQYLVESGTLASGTLDPARIDAIADACGLPGAAQARGDGKDRSDLLDALERWLASDERHEALAFPHLAAEEPFFIKAPTRFGEYLEGAIDLLASDPATGQALVVDYKTGYAKCTPEEYQHHHQMQAQFYAYVLLSQGYSEVTCKFVAVQRDGQTPGKPMVATYGPFTSESGLSLDW